jgi:hypothetical protein
MILRSPTIPQSPPSHLQDYSICNNARLEFSTIFVPSFDPYEWCLKNGLQSGGLNPGPLGHESSALTTRTRLLTYLDVIVCGIIINIIKWGLFNEAGVCSIVGIYVAVADARGSYHIHSGN